MYTDFTVKSMFQLDLKLATLQQICLHVERILVQSGVSYPL